MGMMIYLNNKYCAPDAKARVITMLSARQQKQCINLWLAGTAAVSSQHPITPAHTCIPHTGPIITAASVHATLFRLMLSTV